MSESLDGLIDPCTRQNGALIGTGVGGSLPTMADGGVTFVAALTVALPKVFPARLAQLAADAEPAVSDKTAIAANALADVKSALRLDS